MIIATLHETIIGRDARDLREVAVEHSAVGARAALETFYYAFNQKSLPVFDAIWANDPLIQLNNPLGGIQRGHTQIRELYRRIFEGPADVWVEFYDFVAYFDQNVAVYAGRERGSFTVNDTTIPLAIRTTRVFRYLGNGLGWRQVHHHGSIDDADLLRRYQTAVSNPPSA